MSSIELANNLVEKAIEALEQVESPSLRAITKAAGSSTQMVYTLFGGAAGLWAAAAETSTMLLLEALATAPASREARIRAWWTWLDDHTGPARAIVRAGSSSKLFELTFSGALMLQGTGDQARLIGARHLYDQGVWSSEDALQVALGAQG